MVMESICPLIFCEVVVGSTFAISLFSKIRNFSQYVNTIRAFRLVPEELIQRIAVLVLLLEFLTLFLLANWKLLAFWLASILLIIFTIVIAIALRRKIRTSCNCFGVNSHFISPIDLVRNIGFLVCSIVGIWLVINSNLLLMTSSLSLGITGLSAIVFVFALIQLSEIYRFLQSTY
jgi:hypothetical protein